MLDVCPVSVPQCRGGIPGAAGWDRNIDKVSSLAFPPRFKKLSELKTLIFCFIFYLHTTRLYMKTTCILLEASKSQQLVCVFRLSWGIPWITSVEHPDKAREFYLCMAKF